MLLKTKRKKRNLKGNKTINNLQKQNNKSPRVLFEIVFFEVWQFKYKSVMSYIWLKKKIHDPEFSFAIISVWKDGKNGKDGTGKETDSILRPFICIYTASQRNMKSRTRYVKPFCEPSSAYIYDQSKNEKWNMNVNANKCCINLGI